MLPKDSISDFSSDNSCLLLATIAVLNPSLASFSAITFPIPSDAPVMSAVFIILNFVFKLPILSVSGFSGYYAKKLYYKIPLPLY